jgi:hypothetical protein
MVLSVSARARENQRMLFHLFDAHEHTATSVGPVRRENALDNEKSGTGVLPSAVIPIGRNDSRILLLLEAQRRWM